MCGLKNEAAQSDLTLKKAINISVTMEMATEDAQQLHATGKVHKLNNSSQDAQRPCFRCDKSGHVASACWCKDMYCRH